MTSSICSILFNSSIITPSCGISGSHEVPPICTGVFLISPVFLKSSATEKIGTFIVRYSEKGRKFKIVLDVDLSGRGTYAKLYVLQHDNIIDDEGVRFWISHRVMPRNRINGGKLLQSMGISEYDQYAILKYNNGYCGRDLR